MTTCRNCQLLEDRLTRSYAANDELARRLDSLLQNLSNESQEARADRLNALGRQQTIDTKG